MLLCNDEERYQDYEQFVNKGPYRGPRKPLHRYSRQKYAEDVILLKTLSDAAGTLSKKEQKRILTVPANEIQFGVPYSLNKHQRWETINPKSLLVKNSGNQEVLVLNGVVQPSAKAADGSYRIQSIHILDNDRLSSTSTSGKPKELSYFDAALRERRNILKDEIEPARIHFNIMKLSSSPSHSAGKSLKKRIRKNLAVAQVQDIVEECENPLNSSSDTTFDSELEEQFNRESSIPSASITLGDFITSPASASEPFTFLHETSDKPLPLHEKILSKTLMPPQLIDISEATHQKCIFDVFEISCYQLKLLDLREQVIELLSRPAYERYVMHWFDATTVSVSNQPLADPTFAVFFEVRNNCETLRIRVNTNTRYCGSAHKESLAHIIAAESKDFESLFSDVMYFIWKTRTTEQPKPLSSKENNRFHSFSVNFKHRVNSTQMAAAAKRCEEYEQMVFVKNQYRSFPSDQYIPITADNKKEQLCCSCKSTLKTDLFLTLNGMMCKDCIASYVIHQLRLSQFPIQVPLITPVDCSPLDLLYAILPVPLISVLIKNSFSHFYDICTPGGVLTKCPQCTRSLAINEPNDYTCTVCPDCNFHWCYRCYWEPHWPMPCDEFKEWSRKWDEQYHIERLPLDKDERALRITCACGQVFYTPETTAHGTYCPRKGCEYRYDRSGLMRNRSDLWWWYTAEQRKKFMAKEGEMRKWGVATEQQYIAVQRMIKREFGSVCAKARDIRFDVEKRQRFKTVVLKQVPYRKEQCELIDTRVTALLLVEHSMAWLSMHREHSSVKDLKALSTQLLQHVIDMETKIEDGKTDVASDINAVQKGITKLISSYRKALSKVYFNTDAM